MKAMVLEEFKKIMSVKEVPDPKLTDDNSVIVRVEANGICRSDWHWWMKDWGWIGLEPELPRILGHEFCGSVEEVGKNIKNFKKGDRVIVPFCMGDGASSCPECMSGQNHICENLNFVGCFCDGGYGKYVNIINADFNLVPLPESINFSEGSVLGCRFMTSYHGVVSRGKVQPGEHLVVYGAGGIGLAAMHIADSLGAHVIAVDISDDKLEKAKSIGAHELVNAKSTDAVEAVTEITKGGAHMSLDALGEPETCLNAVLSLRRGGRHVQIGLTTSKDQGNVALPIDLMIAKENTFLASLGMPKAEYAGMLKHITDGKINLSSLITRKVSIEEAPKIIHSMTEFNTSGMNVVNHW